MEGDGLCTEGPCYTRQNDGHICGTQNYDPWVKVIKIRTSPENSDICTIASSTRGKIYWNVKERGTI